MQRFYKHPKILEATTKNLLN